MKTKKLWLIFISVVSFAVLGYYGVEIYRQAPPIPDKVILTNGTVLFTGQDIKDGQNVWQSIGGQEVGTVWGHGAYVAPDWSADWLHRESLWILNHWAQSYYKTEYVSLNDEQKAVLQVRLKKEMRTNTYDKNTKELKISPVRDSAITAVSLHYTGLFMNDPSLNELRQAYSTVQFRINIVEN